MTLRTTISAALLAVALSLTGFIAIRPVEAKATPAVKITSVTTSGMCITVKVTVSNFRLVTPEYSNPKPLNGSQGHIHYVLNGKILPTRDATTKQSHTFCGASQFVKKGSNVVEVYLATYSHTMFPGTMAVKRTIMVK